MDESQTEWPRRWLMTDERIGDRLWVALERLSSGDGIVFRHYALASEERRQLAEDVAAWARANEVILAVARDEALAEAVGAALVHNPVQPPTRLPWSRSVHDEAEAQQARTAALAFIGPVYPTRSHPGAPALGIEAALKLARAANCPAIALGGMDEARGIQMIRSGFYGWAGIDAWVRTA